MPKDALANPVALAVLGVLLERAAHPYELARVLAERGVPVNRGSLYDTVEAMARAGWVQSRPSERRGARPRRTPYVLTDAGRAELIRRLDAQIRVPRREYPEFLGAVSHLGVLGPQRAVDALRERVGRLAEVIARSQERFDQVVDGGEAPRLFVIEADYALAILRAERDWVLGLIDDITGGRLAGLNAQSEEETR
jgi:DNA-binding PadR family transcriptional regulator